MRCSSGKLLLAVLLLAVAGCGREVQVTTAQAAPGQDLQPLAPQQVAGVLVSFCNNFEDSIDRTAQAIEQLEPTNAIRTSTLHWRILVSDAVTSALEQDNADVAVVQMWYLSLSLEYYYSTGPGRKEFGKGQAEAMATLSRLRAQAENIARRIFSTDRFPKVSEQVHDAVKHGEIVSASQFEQSNLFSELFDASGLQTLLNIPLAPFNALSGVGKGGDALSELATVGAHAVALAQRYPRMLSWYLQLVMVKIQEQDAIRDSLKDLDQLTHTAQEFNLTIRTLPERLRSETTAFLQQTVAVQGTAQQTLEHAQATADALEHAARALDTLLSHVDAFLAGFRNRRAAEPAHSGPPERPFDIREYTAALQAATVTAHEITEASQALTSATRADELRDRLQVIKGATDHSLAEVHTDLHQLVDHIAWRACQVLVLFGLILLLLVRLHARWRRV